MATRQRPRSTRLLVAVLISLSLAVITLDFRQRDEGPLAALGHAAKTAMAPLQRATTNITEPVRDFLSGLAHLPSLQEENERMRDEIDALRAQVGADAHTAEENERLQGLLGLRRILAPDAVAASVVGNGVSNFEWSITIDRGSSDGIAMDQPVVTGSVEAPMLVGRIVSVQGNSADVRLIIDRDSAAAAVLEDAGEPGTIHGAGDEDLKMTDIETGTEVGPSERVFTLGYQVAGQPGLYPRGLLIGEVSRTVPADNATEEYVEVRPAVDFATLQNVLVLKTRTEA